MGAVSMSGPLPRLPGMMLDYDELVSLRRRHPAWRLLAADSAPMVAAFLHAVFVAENVRTISELELVEHLEDALHEHRTADPQSFPKPARSYLTDWSDPTRGWLRKFYPPGDDTAHYDLSPAAEKALRWLPSLAARTFIGTESRLLTAFELLRQIVEGAEEDPAARIATLHRRRDEIDEQIARIEAGRVPVLDDTSIRDRFQQFADTAADLLSDFREVEENFRSLDRDVREQIAGWDGARGALLDDVIGARDAIGHSDQGVSFQAFWDFLMASDRQAELEHLMERVLDLPALQSAARSDPRLRFVLLDWLRAGDSVQRTVAGLSQQLRRFLDDQAYLENRRIAELVRSIEGRALALRDDQPTTLISEISQGRAQVHLPMARRMYRRATPVELDDTRLDRGSADFSTEGLFSQFSVDTQALRHGVIRALAGRDQVTLAEVVADAPIRQGLAEVVAYLDIADDVGAVFRPDARSSLSWTSSSGQVHATVPDVIFVRDSGSSASAATATPQERHA